ncbi:cell division ATP-binding protein FtsE [Carboxylicivirga linearis]|uniref:ATP-binding cassette domain-containing protein n=1 Tax=Carboxylicivirga linearis TaxID=1628157 RepID=A0ABS5JWS6_9BACT|nr:ATP-binding cassette domain-containing protein [Carboxylicivirga linearis]MBS2099274.1 ATP-binding cassette domain-containing protein [Carboxylicivirga linearis]
MDKSSHNTVNKEGNIVDFNNVYIRQQEHLILQDVNFHIKPGEFVYLIGKVGSGKSSLLKTMYNELPLQEGYGFVAGYPLKSLKKSKVPFLRRKMGIVFQDFQLLSDRTVYNNLLFVLKATGWKNKKEIDKRIREVLSHVDMVHKGYKMPHQLSGGEQQRIGIARALLNEPDLILADEPTGNLDPETSDELMLLLKKICEGGRTVVMATHNYNLLKKFPGRTIRCEDTRLTESKQEEIDFDLLD